ncbi:NAD(P)-dependent oxidoreductase [Nocardia sp. BMG51109]|uniref:NAD(P)-dependent oxidoreductase n=1 Tax=Nocardia sp. BMG51109 TaxID=1056816 RepID=UPI000465FD7D|nr:NAD(P)-binding domain-containing protein [Nocardia sp. BMG51109]
MIIALLHPGNMGAAIGARLVKAGHTVLWNDENRSATTLQRANAAHLTATHDIGELLGQAEVVFSICPAAAAPAVAETVAQHQYSGLYVDANAISPQQMLEITATMGSARVVDAAISGPPPRDTPSAKLFLAGPDHAVGVVGQLLEDAGLDADPVSETIGAASALKMALISFQRTARLLAAVAHGLADAHGVTHALVAEATRIGADVLADRDGLSGAAARAWRWNTEMHEVSTTLKCSNLPSELAIASEQLYEALVGYKDDWAAPPERVIQSLKK